MLRQLRDQLLTYARGYEEACERDLEAAQRRLERARKIAEHVRADKGAAGCPTPILDETSGQAQRFAARVDALLMAVYDAEKPPAEI